MRKTLELQLVTFAIFAGTCVLSNVIVEEGKYISLVVENSASANITTIRLLTFDEYKELLLEEASINHSKCDAVVSTISDNLHILPMSLNELDISSFSYLHQAEDSDIGQKEYEVPIDCKKCTIKINTEEDEAYENKESLVMVINGRKECAVLMQIIDNDAVEFMWNVGQLNVFEDEGIIRRLRIIKIRETEQSMNVSVEVIPKNESNEAHQGNQFRLLNHTFIFDNATFNLSVPFEVYNDTVERNPKHFYLMFNINENKNHTLSTYSNTVKIFIINSINFATEPHNITANLGRTVHFPCSRKTDNNVHSTVRPKWWLTFSNGTTTKDVTRFSNLQEGWRGLNVTVQDLDFNLTSFTCFYVILVPDPDPNVNDYTALSINSTSGFLTINFPMTNFSLKLPESRAPFARVGDPFDFIVIKQGGGNYRFNVTLVITGQAALQQSSRSIILDPHYDQQSVSATILNAHPVLNSAVIKMAIAEPVLAIIEGVGIKLITNIGDPLNITVYSNVFYVQFQKQMINTSSLELQQDLCVDICEPGDTGDTYFLDPSRKLQLHIQLTQDENNWFELSADNITLATNRTPVCFNVTFSHNISDTIKCQNSTNFTVNVTWIRDPLAEYTVYYCLKNTTVVVSSKSCKNDQPAHNDHDIGTGIGIGIGIGIVVSVVIGICVFAIVVGIRKQKFASRIR